LDGDGLISPEPTAVPSGKRGVVDAGFTFKNEYEDPMAIGFRRVLQAKGLVRHQTRHGYVLADTQCAVGIAHERREAVAMRNRIKVATRICRWQQQPIGKHPQVQDLQIAASQVQLAVLAT
jgi:hypothetical protein